MYMQKELTLEAAIHVVQYDNEHFVTSLFIVIAERE